MTPRVTIAILSWNRLNYLRATIASARRCITYPDLEWIVSDNASAEPGLSEYLATLDWVEHRWSKVQTHADAMNEIVARSTGKYLLLWPEDMQFVVEGTWMTRLIAALEENSWIGSVGLNFLRRKTLRRLLGAPRLDEWPALVGELRRRGKSFRIPRRLEEPIGLQTFGWRLPGVIASGIPSLTRSDCWRALGPWRTRSKGASIVDSSLGAEDDMILRFQRGPHPWQQATLLQPVAADIVNDDKGCKAKVRGGKRYGRYTPPPQGPFYYDIVRQEDLPRNEGGFPVSFESCVRPRGFHLPLDAQGNMLKASINMDFVSEIVSAERS